MNIIVKTIRCIVREGLYNPSVRWLKRAKNVINAVVNFFNPKTNTIKDSFQKRVVKGSGSVSGGYSEFMLRGQKDRKIIPKSDSTEFLVGVFTKASIINATGKIGCGSNQKSFSLKSVVDVLVTTVQLALSTVGICFKVRAAMISGRATLEFKIFNTQIEFGITGDIFSIGTEITIGSFDGAFDLRINASCGIGGGFVFRVKPCCKNKNSLKQAR